MISFGNDELAAKPVLGESIVCPKCGQQHKIEYGQKLQEDGTYKESKLLAFYRCGKKSYLAGIDGKNIMEPNCTPADKEDLQDTIYRHLG